MGYDYFLHKQSIKDQSQLSWLNIWKYRARQKAIGQLVVLGFDITVFTPAPYQRRRLQRPSMEF